MRPDYTPKDVERFWSKVDRRDGPDACWPWLRSKNDKGYGTFYFMDRTLGAHRVAYFLTNGSWPEPCGCHSCDNPACCNPSHIFPGTHQDNMRDRQTKGRTSRASRNGGESHGSTTLTAEDVSVIRLRYATEVITMSDLALEYRVSRACIGDLIRGRAWASVPPPAGVELAPTPRDKFRNVKLTADDVREIRRRYDAGDVTQTELAREFGTTFGNISLIVLRKNWKHI